MKCWWYNGLLENMMQAKCQHCQTKPSINVFLNYQQPMNE